MAIRFHASHRLILAAFMGLFALCTDSLAQSEEPSLIDMTVRSWPNPFRPSLASQEGSPFLFESWNPGKIQTVKGIEFEASKLKYNLLHGRLLVIIDGEEAPRMIVPIRIKSFTLETSDSTYQFTRHLVPISETKTPMDPFFIELSSGSYFLLARPGKQPQIEKKNVLAQIDEQHNVKYVDFVDYFIETPDGKIHPFKNSKKVKADIFGEQLPELERFAKQSKLKWGKPRDLSLIVQKAGEL